MPDFLEWVTHGVKQGRFEMNAAATVGVSLVVVVLTLVTALYLMLISRTAARGRYIEGLQAQAFGLQRENQQLMVDIAEQSTVSGLRERAEALGLVAAETIEFVADLEQ